ncbi:MAG: LamG domain-containing protein, partial [Planctomycetota bacterium]
LQMLFTFYAGLVTGDKDPAYYGHKVTAEFPEAVLMRWKVEDSNYRVIFGDLTVGDVTPDELAELEAAPLNTKPIAIKPQPAGGAAAAAFAEVELSWMPGAYVTEHKVYFGIVADQLSLLVGVTDSCSVTAPALERRTTYYWRVDEVQPDGTIAIGDVWSFNTGKLVGWWKLDGDANDSSGSGNDGTVKGNPNWVIGQIGGALQFDGLDDYIQTDYAADLPLWTVAIWVNSPAAPSNAASAGPVHRENNLQINWNHSFADFRGAAGLRVENKWYAASFGELEANTWYHLAATYDGENLKAYKNGVLITDNPDPSGAPNKEWATLKFAKHSNYGDYFEGTIDDVRLYSYDLSADEVAAIYAAQTREK